MTISVKNLLSPIMLIHLSSLLKLLLILISVLVILLLQHRESTNIKDVLFKIQSEYK